MSRLELGTELVKKIEKESWNACLDECKKSVIEFGKKENISLVKYINVELEKLRKV